MIFGNFSQTALGQFRPGIYSHNLCDFHASSSRTRGHATRGRKLLLYQKKFRGNMVTYINDICAKSKLVNR